MGHRGNVVIKRGGAVEAYYSQWGALSLAAELLEGPAVIGQWAACRRVDHLIDNVFCEGIALADFDERRLLAWAGLAVRYLRPIRLAYLQMVRTVWPGWRVEWADRGVLDVADAIRWPTAGLDLKPVVCPGDPELRRPTMSFTWATVVAERTADFPFTPEPGPLLLLGPRLLDFCRDADAGSLPAEDALGGGLLIKPAERSLEWWSAGTQQPEAAAVEAAWPGWRIGELPDGLASQVAGSGRDPSSHALAPERVRRYLADELFSGLPRDAEAALRRLEAWMRENEATT